MKRLLAYYNFIVIFLMVLSGFLFAQSSAHLASAVFFFPLFVYFAKEVVPRRKRAVVFATEEKLAPGKTKKSDETVVLEKVPEGKEGVDFDRRSFLKLIGTTGMAVFIFSIFGVKKAQAAFFGSVPGPGIVSLKDSSGTTIDPAEKHPTDGYNITELDDSTPAYYGFTNKSGAWFIMKEDSTGAYRYTAGSSDFTNVTTGWPNRANLTYDYFENVF